jgi:hypothetical protein
MPSTNSVATSACIAPARASSMQSRKAAVSFSFADGCL